MPLSANIYYWERAIEVCAFPEALGARAAFMESGSDGDSRDVRPTKMSADPFEGVC